MPLLERMKDRFWINRNTALLDILNENAIITEVLMWCIEIFYNGRIYVLSWWYKVITVK